jgi:hypothetical protein
MLDARREQLASEIDNLWYPNYGGAWLKTFRVDSDARLLQPRERLQHTLADQLWYTTPEHAPWDKLTSAEWHPVERPALLERLDEMLTRAADDLANDPPDGDVMADLATIRRWFATELWGSLQPAWFVNPATRFVPMAAAVDPDLIAVVWLP